MIFIGMYTQSQRQQGCIRWRVAQVINLRSDFRRMTSSRKNGISDKAKKMGPPLRWIYELIISGLTRTQSCPIMKMRRPFLRIARGITPNVNSTRFLGALRKRWPASRLVMNNTRVECIPLHAGATSRLKLGKSSTRPCRKIGVADILNNTSAA